MDLYTIDPLSDTRWDDLVDHHPNASAFHQRGWLQALASTYGYKPCVLTSTPEGKPLLDGIALCRVSSWITGTRLVSLPFTDHCQPLLRRPEDGLVFTKWLRAERDRQQWKYIELRPVSLCAGSTVFQPSHSYCMHELDMTPGLDRIFQNLHKGSIQRKIRRAERERLSLEVDNSKRLLDEFYYLLLITRRRHRVLPQPRKWFENLIKYMGNKIEIRVARKNGNPVAAILTLRHRSSMIYKYGCSDHRYHNLGGMPFLFWNLIEDSKALGVQQIDLGRTDLDNQGLITFKNRLGATSRLLKYYRSPNARGGQVVWNWEISLVRRLFAVLPNFVYSTAGRSLYKHLG